MNENIANKMLIPSSADIIICVSFFASKLNATPNDIRDKAVNITDAMLIIKQEGLDLYINLRTMLNFICIIFIKI